MFDDVLRCSEMHGQPLEFLGPAVNGALESTRALAWMVGVIDVDAHSEQIQEKLHVAATSVEAFVGRCEHMNDAIEIAFHMRDIGTLEEMSSMLEADVRPILAQGPTLPLETLPGVAGARLRAAVLALLRVMNSVLDYKDASIDALRNSDDPLTHSLANAPLDAPEQDELDLLAEAKADTEKLLTTDELLKQLRLS